MRYDAFDIFGIVFAGIVLVVSVCHMLAPRKGAQRPPQRAAWWDRGYRR
jgi:hypothetical protein